MDQQETTILLETQDFNEVAGIEQVLRTNGIPCFITRVRPEEGARMPTKRITVATASHARALELLKQLQDRRYRLRRIANKRPTTTSDGITTEPGLAGPDSTWGIVLDSLIDTTGDF